MTTPPSWQGMLQERLLTPALCALRGRFHSHVTVQAHAEAVAAFCAARPGLKATIIDLADVAGQRKQQDRMVTAYHFSPGGAAGMAHIAAQLARTADDLQAAGMPVLRIKLEHEALPTLEPFSPQQYREIHIQLHLPADPGDRERTLAWLRAQAPAFGYVPSQNPAQILADGSRHHFLNLRRYAGTLPEIDAQVQALCHHLQQVGGLSIVEVKQETTLLDTHQERDRWWA